MDIRTVKGKDKWDAVREVIKYPTKVVSFLDKPRLVNEFLLATERVNLAYGFGAMYRVKTKKRNAGGMRCPLYGGTDIDRGSGYGFCVPRIAVQRKGKGGLAVATTTGGTMMPPVVEIDMEIGLDNPMKYKRSAVKAGLVKLFELGFKPNQLPPFGVGRLTTTQRYYWAWRAGGGKVVW